MKSVSQFDFILVLYRSDNPRLRRRAAWLGIWLRQRLQLSVEQLQIRGTATEQEAWHAIRKCAFHERPLVVSVGGDGALHLAANAVVRQGIAAVVAMYPCGTANDNAHEWHQNRRTVRRAIVAGRSRRMDLLECSGSENGWSALAAGYIGLFVTAEAAARINANQIRRLPKPLRLLYQTAAVLLALARHKPVKARLLGLGAAEAPASYNNLSWHLIRRMASLLTIANSGRDDDGIAEMLAVKSKFGYRTRVLLMAIKAAVAGLSAQQPGSYWQVEVWEDCLAQIDGEVQKIKAGDTLTIKVLPQALEVLA